MEMKKLPVYLIISLICLTITGCGTSDARPEIETENNVAIKKNTQTEDCIEDIISDHVTVNAKMTVPDTSFVIYETKLKEFNIEEVSALLWSEDEKEDLQIQEYDLGTSEVTLQDERLVLGMGSMMYTKNDNIKYLLQLASYAEENNILQTKNLSFISKEDAEKNVETFLSGLKLGGSIGEKEIYALSKEDLSDIQSTMKTDEHYIGFYDSGKYQECVFGANDEFYYMKYAFELDGLPILGESDPTIQMLGGVDQSLLAYPMEAIVLFSNSGICEIRLSGALESLESDENYKEIITYDGIKNALNKKFGDVILSDDYNLSKIWLEYFPKIKVDSFDQVEVIPVWCCEFDINGTSDTDYALRFNAFTGEEIS